MKPVASATAPSVKAIGKPMKMTANSTPSATRPSTSLLIPAPRALRDAPSGQWPKRMACAHFRHSLKPWISSSSPVSGIISLKGQVIGCHELLTKVSLVT